MAIIHANHALHAHTCAGARHPGAPINIDEAPTAREAATLMTDAMRLRNWLDALTSEECDEYASLIP